MIIKIDRHNCLKRYTKFPLRDYDYEKDEDFFFSPKVFNTYKLTLKSKSKRGLTKLLATEITKLIKDFDFKNLIFLGDNPDPWMSKLSLERDDDYKPLVDALQYLANNKVGKRFNGALEIDLFELPIFIKHFYSLVRCDASLPYFFFMDEKENILGSIHYSGELTIETLNKKADKKFKDIIGNTEFIIKK